MEPSEETGKAITEAEKRHWLDAMAEMEQNHSRRYEGLARRVSRLESRTLFAPMDDETKMLMWGIGAYVIIQVIPILLDRIAQWSSSQSER